MVIAVEDYGLHSGILIILKKIGAKMNRSEMKKSIFLSSKNE